MSKMLYAVVALLLFTNASAQRGGGGKGGGGGGGGKNSGCSSDSDCTKARKPVCDAGVCVAAPSSSSSSDGGCTSNSDCTRGRKNFCDVSSGECVKDDPNPSSSSSSSSSVQPPPSSDSSSSDGGGSGSCNSNHRHRENWSSLNNAKRQLYIDGFKKLADRGITQQFTKAHKDDSEHNNPEFLPWHREFIWMMENEIRALGGEFACFAMPYWDWTDEPTPNDVKTRGDTLFITDSGLGGDSNGACLSDNVWGEGHYHPHDGDCLERDLDYPDEAKDCLWQSPAQMMDLISKSDKYKNFRSSLEGSPHADPHICIGGDAAGQMITYSSPDDPIFYLHHTYVDYIWALWQDCHNYDGVEVNSNSDLYNDNVDYQLRYRPLTNDATRVSETFDLLGGDYDFSYEKGPFWDNADVDSNSNCGSGNINGQWFYGSTNARKALKSGNMRGMKFSKSQQLLHADDEYDESSESYEGNDGDYEDPDGETECDHRSTLDYAREMMRDLKDANPSKDRKDLVHEWAIAVCQYEQGLTEEGLCDAGMGGSYAVTVPWDDCSDESKYPIDPRTNDIKISRAELIGDPGLTECQRESRNRMWNWAKEMNQLKFVCMGCFDPLCDRDFLEGKCPLDTGVHHDDDEAMSFIDTLYAGQAPQMQLYAALAMVVAALAMMTLFAVSKWCVAGKAKTVEGARYGAV